MKAKYKVLERTSQYIWIIDTDGEGCMSVTNDAEAVIQDLLKKNLIDQFTLVYYTDTDGAVDQLCHDGTNFTYFEAGGPDLLS